MNKRNKILVACLALLLTLSIGYALFSETITINGTATAKGSFDITTTCNLGMPSALVSAMEADGYSSSIFDEGGTKNDICDVKNNIITINSDLLYPTAARYFTAEMKNTGTMDAVLSISELSQVLSGATVDLYNKSNNAFYKTLSAIDTYDYGTLRLNWVFVKLTNGTYIHTDEDLMTNKATLTDGTNSYLRIKPNESIVMVFQAVWDKNAVQTEYYSKAQLNADVTFSQFTSNMTDWELDDFCLNGC